MMKVHIFLILYLVCRADGLGREYALLVGSLNGDVPMMELYSQFYSQLYTGEVLADLLPELPEDFSPSVPSAIFLEGGVWGNGILLVCSWFPHATACYYLDPWSSGPLTWESFQAPNSDKHYSFLPGDSPGIFWALGSWTTTSFANKTWEYRQRPGNNSHHTDGWVEGPELVPAARFQCSVKFSVDNESVFLLIGGEEKEDGSPNDDAGVQVLCKTQNDIFCEYADGTKWDIQK